MDNYSFDLSGGKKRDSVVVGRLRDGKEYLGADTEEYLICNELVDVQEIESMNYGCWG